MRGGRHKERQERACFDISNYGPDGHEVVKHTRRRTRAVVAEEDGCISLIDESLSSTGSTVFNGSSTYRSHFSSKIVRRDNLRLGVSDVGQEVESGCVYGVRLIDSRDDNSSLEVNCEPDVLYTAGA